MALEASPFAQGLHIVTYDVRGTILATGQEKEHRQTGLVTQTHQLIGGLAMIEPGLQLSVTQTGVEEPSTYHLKTPEGPTVLAQGINTRFADYLYDPVTGGKDKKLVHHYYEDQIRNPENPVYRSLAEQYAAAVRTAGSPNILLQNSNPTVSLLKAEELGCLDEITLGQLNVTAVIHDVEGYEERLRYICDALGWTKMNAKLIAVSEFVYRQLVDMGVPEDLVSKVPNGIDVQEFEDRLDRVRNSGLFQTIAERNGLPVDGKMILVPARRVAHKGHLDVIQAAKILKDRGSLDGMYVAFTGCHMLDTQGLQFESVINQAIARAGLEDKIFCLDDLTDDEVAACYDAAHVSVLASTEPEGFAYANIKAMLAGTPVITTRLGGPLDYIVHGKTGLFVDVHAPHMIANALEKLDNNPEAYASIARQGRQRAAEFTVESMVDGYVTAIAAGRPKLPIRIHTSRQFEQIGEGMHTKVFKHVPGNGFVVQTFKPDHTLSTETLSHEYDYLVEAYADMPGLVPKQRLLAASESHELGKSLLIKREVQSDPAKNTLLKVQAQELDAKTFDQLRQFVDITKRLFTHTSSDPSIQYLGPRVPDLIDPEFTNLLIDNDGNLRLVDTNKLISTRHLNGLADTGAKLDIGRRVIHALFLRRLMFIESKFFGRTAEELRADPFYSQYLDDSSFTMLFEQSAAVGEPISVDDSRHTRYRSAG